MEVESDHVSPDELSPLKSAIRSSMRSNKLGGLVAIVVVLAIKVFGCSGFPTELLEGHVEVPVVDLVGVS